MTTESIFMHTITVGGVATHIHRALSLAFRRRSITRSTRTHTCARPDTAT